MHPLSEKGACMIIVCGLPATGKTTVAMALAEALNIDYLGTDQQREKMGLLGKYDKASKQYVYDNMLRKAGKILKVKRRIIIEGTFHKELRRLPFLQLASDFHARVIWIELTASDALIEERMKRKRMFSEADYAVYKKIKSELEPYPGDRLIMYTDRQKLQEIINAISRTLPHECK